MYFNFLQNGLCPRRIIPKVGVCCLKFYFIEFFLSLGNVKETSSKPHNGFLYSLIAQSSSCGKIKDYKIDYQCNAHYSLINFTVLLPEAAIMRMKYTPGGISEMSIFELFLYEEISLTFLPVISVNVIIGMIFFEDEMYI